MWWKQKDYSKDIREIRNTLIVVNSMLSNRKTENDEAHTYIGDQIHNVRDRVKKLNDSVKDRIEVMDSGVDDKLVGVVKLVENKIRVLVGDTEKSSIIANLLKRIAELEQVKESREKGMNTEEIIAKRDEIHKEYLKSDREDNLDVKSQAKLDILNEILGE